MHINYESVWTVSRTFPELWFFHMSIVFHCISTSSTVSLKQNKEMLDKQPLSCRVWEWQHRPWAPCVVKAVSFLRQTVCGMNTTHMHAHTHTHAHRLFATWTDTHAHTHTICNMNTSTKTHMHACTHTGTLPPPPPPPPPPHTHTCTEEHMTLVLISQEHTNQGCQYDDDDVCLQSSPNMNCKAMNDDCGSFCIRLFAKC